LRPRGGLAAIFNLFFGSRPIVDSNFPLNEISAFNINAYEDEKSVFTTLAEGRIQIKMPDRQLLNLQPGEQLAYTNGLSRIIMVDMEEITAWKTGWFIFNRLELYAILKQLSRWYTIDFVLTDGIGQKQFSGIVSRSNNLSEVLKIMEGTGVKFTLKGSKIEVSR
jgi:ferric-dicitrate binding protein FerR (iron transport regulator)